MLLIVYIGGSNDNEYCLPVAMEKDTEKQTILGLLKDILDAIEQLLDLHQFGGSADKFFSLVDKYSELRPVSTFLSSFNVPLVICVCLSVTLF